MMEPPTSEFVEWITHLPERPTPVDVGDVRILFRMISDEIRAAMGMPPKLWFEMSEACLSVLYDHNNHQVYPEFDCAARFQEITGSSFWAVYRAFIPDGLPQAVQNPVDNYNGVIRDDRPADAGQPPGTVTTPWQ